MNISQQFDTTVDDPNEYNKKPSILIVEDNPDNLKGLKALLGEGYTIIEARDGEEALEKVFSSQPDLVFLDISIPKISGFEVAAIIKKTKETSNIPVIAVTGMPGIKEKVLESGCNDYLAKPIIYKELKSCLKKWINEKNFTK